MARRYSGNPNPLMEVGGLAIDLAARSIHRAGRAVGLTAREWALFEALVQRPSTLLSKAQLEERLYSFTEKSKAIRSKSISAASEKNWGTT